VRLLTGEQVTACVQGGYINVTVNVPISERELISGLLGNADGDPSNDLQPRGGDALSLTPYYDDFYGIFGESWRVRGDEALFDSPPEATPDCPRGAFRWKDLPQPIRDHAIEACRGVDVVPSLMGACATDVAVMGDGSALDYVGVRAPNAVVVLRDRDGCGCAGGADRPGGSGLLLGCVAFAALARRRRARRSPQAADQP
jgi:hypothetical protein